MTCRHGGEGGILRHRLEPLVAVPLIFATQILLHFTPKS
jgi:hypothetical protein